MNTDKIKEYLQHKDRCGYNEEALDMNCDCGLVETLALLSAPADPGDIEGEARNFYYDRYPAAAPDRATDWRIQDLADFAKYMLSLSAPAVQVQQREGDALSRSK